MNFPIEDKLVVAVASSALFDLTESDSVFRTQGKEAYRAFQRAHESEVLAPGVAFSFVRRLLSLNGARPEDQPVEVVLISRNDPDTGLRVFKSIAHHGLSITRAAFTSGSEPWAYIPAFNACLFLSANPEDVREAVQRGLPAGRVLNRPLQDDEADHELRIAFDFDGVLADDDSERVYREEGLARFQETERARAQEALHPGPLQRLLMEIARVQGIEQARRQADPSYAPRLRTAICTARSAPAHERVITTLRQWGLRVDEAFFLGGLEKRRILDIFHPHIFFDDQMDHLAGASSSTPSVHVPFGVANSAS